MISLFLIIFAILQQPVPLEPISLKVVVKGSFTNDVYRKNEN